MQANVISIQERFRGCLLGLAAGDAVGTTVEFKPRGTFEPVTDMIGQGPFALKPGAWTDDTSMALCLATSLVHSRGFDAADQMARYVRWYETGYLSSTDRCFDIGNTTVRALTRYKATGEVFAGSTRADTAGNGCLMRLAPIPMAYLGQGDRLLHYATESARTTHGAPECLEASRLLADILGRALSGPGQQGSPGKDDVLFAQDARLGGSLQSQALVAVFAGDYRAKTRNQIRGTGYVVQSLEAALWCFYTTASFESAILAAANLGDDADTTAAICGQVAGAFYGASGIPAHWLDRLIMRQDIQTLADQLLALSSALSASSASSPSPA